MLVIKRLRSAHTGTIMLLESRLIALFCNDFSDATEANNDVAPHTIIPCLR